MIRRGEGFWTDRDAARGAEWLETDGLGGYASSTLAGLNTRRYHGLMVAATRPPVGRSVLLSKLEETLSVDGQRVPLSINRYPGTLDPEGDAHLTEHSWDPFPSFVYEAAGVRLRKTLFLVHGEGTLVVTYSLEEAGGEAGAGRVPLRSSDPRGAPTEVIPTDQGGWGGGPGATVTLDVRPLLAFRDYHGLGRENDAFDGRVERSDGRLTVRPYPSLPALSFAHPGAAVHDGAFWYRRFQYLREKERGFDFEEDLFSPFSLELDLGARRTLSLVVATNGRPASDAPALAEREANRRARVSGPASDRPALRAMRRAADQFLVARGDGTTVIAGYPWFTDWGRDTMIALPGLALATERPEVARRLLTTFAKHVDAGMIPNRFPDAGQEPEYNTVDATLWFVEAVRAYDRKTGDEATARELFPALLSIVDAHLAGTRYGIRVDDDGLLASGADGVQLTWMDAKVGDWVVTPRRGKPVEIQALWFNALSFLAELAARLGDSGTSERLGALAQRARTTFERLFWNEEAGCLFDNVEGGVADGSIRPNQLLAVSLAHPLVTGDRALRIVAAVERHLLTPLGLRTLAPSDARYRGRYQGGPHQRDAAYHQGTVWPWLMGPFVTAYLNAHRHTTGARLRAMAFLKPLVLHLRGQGLGQLPEIFDGDAPQRPEGCFAQAWSVAQLYEAIQSTGLPGGDSGAFSATALLAAARRESD